MSQPLRVSAGTLNFTLPVGNDSAGTMQYTGRALDLETTGRELRTELNYATPLDRHQEVGVALAHRDQPDHAADAPDDNLVAVRWQLRF